MLDGEIIDSGDTTESEILSEDQRAPYFPPVRAILDVLGITHTDLKSSSVSVSTRGLLYLLAEVLKHTTVDEGWYLQTYPDVRAAIYSGDTQSAATHFRVAGYLEGRLPSALPFDPSYYYSKYSDLARVFDSADVSELRNHYLTRGYFEGRAGVADHFDEAQRWRAAANKQG